MSKIKVEVTKTDGYTNKVLAHDGPSGMLVIDKAGAQETVDHPRVQQLIATGVLKQSTAKVEPEPDDPTAARLEEERKAAEEQAAADAAAEKERIAAEEKAEQDRIAADKKASK